MQLSEPHTGDSHAAEHLGLDCGGGQVNRQMLKNCVRPHTHARGGREPGEAEDNKWTVSRWKS